MQHPDFIAWVILFPIGLAVENAILFRWCHKEKHDKDKSDFANTVIFFAYILIAMWLW